MQNIQPPEPPQLDHEAAESSQDTPPAAKKPFVEPTLSASAFLPDVTTAIFGGFST